MLIHVTTSQQAKYNTYYNAYTPRIIRLIHSFMGEFMKEFDLTTDVTIHVRPIKAKGRTSYYGNCNRFGKIEIDCRSGIVETIVNTLAHELAHAEQYQTGLLDWKYIPDLEESRYLWKQVPMDEMPYADRPWEIDANQRADEFCIKYIDKIRAIDKEYGQ